MCATGSSTRPCRSPLLVLPCLVGRPWDLLVVGGQRRDVLIVELAGKERHRIGTGLAEAALPHLHLEGDVVSVLPAEIRYGGRLPRAVRAMTVAAGGNPLRLAADFRELLTLAEERSVCRGQRQERRLDASIVCRHIRDIVF